MRRLLILLSSVAALPALAAAIAPASAADLPVKAPKPLAFPYGQTGCYFGIATKGGVDQTSAGSSLLATSLVSGNLNAAGAGVGGDIGCLKYFGPGGAISWVGFEASAYYQNITASATAMSGATAVQASYASRWSADQTVKLGGFNPLAWLPNLGISFPTLPAPPTVPGLTLIQPGMGYFSVGVEEFGIDGNFFAAGGSTVGIAPLIGAGMLNQITDTTGKPTGNVLDVGGQVVFADKGLQISNFLGNGGAPVFGTLSVGRKYEVYAKIDF